MSTWKSIYQGGKVIASPANLVGKDNELEIVEGNSLRGHKDNCVSPREGDTTADNYDDDVQRITPGNEHMEEKEPSFPGPSIKMVLLAQALARFLPQGTPPHHESITRKALASSTRSPAVQVLP